MSSAMELSTKTLETIGSYVKTNLASWIRDAMGQPCFQVDPVLLERIVRVEEELRATREIITQGFGFQSERSAHADKRLDEQRSDMLAGFTRLDQRIDEQRTEMVSRFAQTDKRLDEQRSDMLAGFTRLSQRIDEQRTEMVLRFAQVDARFEAVDKRFEQVDKRFDDLSRHTARWFTVLTVMLGIIGVAVTVASLV